LGANFNLMDRIIEKKKWPPKRIALIAGVSLLVLFVAYLLFFRSSQSRLYINKNQVTIASVLKDNFQEFIPVDGVVFPRTTIYLDAVQGGFVEKKYVEDGAIVKMGDPILKLVNTSMELSYMDQETRMYDAINNLQNSNISLEQNKFYRQREVVDLQYQIDQLEKDFNRKKLFHNQKVISDKEFEDASRDYGFTRKKLEIAIELKRLDSVASVGQKKQIETSITRMYNNLGLLKQNLDNLIVKSPTDGQLSGFSAEIGETKAAGERLGQIDMQDGYKLRANIDERYVSRVATGQEAEMDFGGSTYALKISKIYTDVSNGTFQVDMLFSNETPEGIKKGQTFQVRLKFSSPTDAIIVKRGGFFQETGGNWIYVVDPSASFAIKRPIRIGRQNTGFYEVLEGLQPGEQVIISSYESFNAKDKLIFK
jgi:HlyD family secretion protein